MLAGALGLWLPVLAQAANIVVNSSADPAGFNPNITVATLGSPVTLRDAVNAANNTAGDDVITFDPALNGQTITLTHVGDRTFGASALLVANGVLTMDGGTSAVTISQNVVESLTDSARIFYVAGSGDLTLKNLTVSGGRARGGDGSGANNGGGGAAGLGGAVVNAGTLNLVQSTFTNNLALGGSANAGGSGGGGGGLGGSNNGVTGGPPNGGGGFGGGGSNPGQTSGGFGGGGAAGTFAIPSGNGGFGGGKGVGGNAPRVSGFGAGSGGYGGSGAGLGGVVFNYGGTVLVTNSTFTGNSAVGGPDILIVEFGNTYNFGGAGSGLGGAIFNLNGSVTTLNSTFAAHIGSAIYSLGDNGIATQAGPILPGTTASVILKNTILAGSTSNGATAVPDFVQNTYDSAQIANHTPGSATSGGAGNLIVQHTGFAGGIVSTSSPVLGALANNGGPTQTMALLYGSAAIDAGDSSLAAALTADQRGAGFPRITNGPVDIGAYERATTLSGVVTADGAHWYLGTDGFGNNFRGYRELPGQVAVPVENGAGVRLGLAADGTVLVQNVSGNLFGRVGSANGFGSAWLQLDVEIAGDGATWFLGPDGIGADFYIYRWAIGGSPTYSDGYATQITVSANGSILARNNAGNDYLRLGSNTGLGTSWQLLANSLASWRALQSLAGDGSQDLANPSRDGVANLLKYAFNMAPNAGSLTNPNIAELPENGTAGLPHIYRDAQGHLVIEFIRRKAATNPGIAYIVETGDALAALQTLSLSGAAAISIDANWERVTVTDPTITPKRFGRVRVQIVP